MPEDCPLCKHETYTHYSSEDGFICGDCYDRLNHPITYSRWAEFKCSLLTGGCYIAFFIAKTVKFIYGYSKHSK